MLCLSLTTGYAIQALACLSVDDGAYRRIVEVARCAKVPRPYLAKIINALVRWRLVAAKRGRSGGIALARPLERISLLEIVEAVEGKHWIGDCLLHLDWCAENMRVCPTKVFWRRIRREITAELRKMTLAEVVSLERGRIIARCAPRPSPAGTRRSKKNKRGPACEACGCKGPPGR
jgi:Rrf2 family protein